MYNVQFVMIVLNQQRMIIDSVHFSWNYLNSRVSARHIQNALKSLWNYSSFHTSLLKLRYISKMYLIYFNIDENQNIKLQVKITQLMYCLVVFKMLNTRAPLFGNFPRSWKFVFVLWILGMSTKIWYYLGNSSLGS